MNRILLVAVFLFAAFNTGAVALPVTWTDVLTVDTGNAVRGPWEQNESRYDFIDAGTLAMDADGNVSVGWVDQTRKRILFQRYTPDGQALLPQPVAVSDSPSVFSWLPRLAHASDNPQRIYAIWQDIIFSGGSHGGDIMFARSDDGGASFSEPVNLSQSIQGAGKGRITRDFWHNGSYDIAIGPEGVIHIVWTEYEGRLLAVRSTDGGLNFSAPRHLAGSEARPARGPSLAAGKDGHVYLAWTIGEDMDADIRVMMSDDDGRNFGPIRIAVKTPGYADGPKLALADDGLLHLAYAQSSGGPFDRFHIAYTRAADGIARFEEPRNISTPAPGDAHGGHFPHLALDNGNPVVAWELVPEPDSFPRGLGIAVSLDGGNSFSSPAVVPESRDPQGGRNGSTQGLLMRKLAVNDDGQLAIVNSSFLENVQSRVWLIRGRLQEAAAAR